MSKTDPIKKPGVNLGAHEYMNIYWTCFPLLFVIVFKTNAECPIFLFRNFRIKVQTGNTPKQKKQRQKISRHFGKNKPSQVI
jgi:hypothetical protein